MLIVMFELGFLFLSGVRQESENADYKESCRTPSFKPHPNAV